VLPSAGQRPRLHRQSRGATTTIDRAAFALDHHGDARLAADDIAAGPQAGRRAFGIRNELDRSKPEVARQTRATRRPVRRQGPANRMDSQDPATNDYDNVPAFTTRTRPITE
jgi:hypothetical protein